MRTPSQKTPSLPLRSMDQYNLTAPRTWIMPYFCGRSQYPATSCLVHPCGDVTSAEQIWLGYHAGGMVQREPRGGQCVPRLFSSLRCARRAYGCDRSIGESAPLALYPMRVSGQITSSSHKSVDHSIPHVEVLKMDFWCSGSSLKNGLFLAVSTYG